MEVKDVVKQCKERMKVGSLSFTFAARLLGARTKHLIFFLYAWCRHCDDVIDKLPEDASKEDKSAALRQLKESTAKSLAVRPRGSNPVFSGMYLLRRSTNIPDYYTNELLNGMEMDVIGYTYKTFADLRLYCYRVAGVVGLMCCHVFGLRDPKALREAEAMGIAMQLTNIARDITEDAEIGRVYVPETWLLEVGLAKEDILLPESKPKLAILAKRLVETAEESYRIGENGIRALPIRAGLAVATARYVYGEIGRMVVKRGPNAWDSRTWVPTHRKVIMLCKAVWLVSKTIPERICSPHYTQPILTIRKHP